ncbi:MAG: zinc transport system ATP-binding protein [Halanaerobium sp. 4-GBenrich]|uniref:Zinc transport system ATP-binding protein n=1 Tax=Halanaerobium congolense TaxID=54121 RepID=A0A1G6JQV9_9FIRM|nr:metal ABC transporter ATP-binding protein [Halanaerobium congolense]KXS49466.1 MAG: zinc transport system ATP-binding protein [Halanaerobium sp. T82-1]ODS50605.1 MAG: zinc transport system ATP-binding protein [Halanaerobium sp. 4-GBenrich]PUU93518.1 MAG: zinc transport system ATP-binding protein [Halanaerobium sp.]PTX16164.1 zinc transport system ATP-binding protein [Halanaerobium congolense]PXV65148.1 zinc transport system ATP-binding protein [Halanaerobium congolense]
MSYAVELKDVSVKYGNLDALKNISLQVAEGSFLGVIGPNGGGKTTLLKVILGLIEPTTGDIKIFGHPLDQAVDKIGYVPQISNFDRNFPISVLDVVLMARLGGRVRFFHQYKKEDIEKAEAVLEQLNLLQLKDRQIGKLSGGQLQRVLIARGLTVEPEILLLDEPTANVDASSTSQIYQLLKELNKEKTIIVVTHDMAAVSSYFDSLACLNEKLYHHGDKQLDQHTTEQVFGCPVDLIAHGHPHHVFEPHGEGENDD